MTSSGSSADAAAASAVMIVLGKMVVGFGGGEFQA